MVTAITSDLRERYKDTLPCEAGEYVLHTRPWCFRLACLCMWELVTAYDN